MGAPVYPKAFLIAETSANPGAMQRALEHLGVQGWRSDADSDADLVTEFAGKSCYMSFDKALNDNLTKIGGRTNAEYIQQGILANGHGSVLEHSTVTFFLTNVSRIVTHELVRHRAGTAFSQTSGRYVRNAEIDMYMPEELTAFPAAVEIFKRANAQMGQNVADLVEVTEINDSKDFGLKKRLTSAFRRLVGNGQANHLVMTANHRAWRHVIELRTSLHAEEEVRATMLDVAKQLKERFPTIYSDMEIRPNGECVFANHKV